MLRFRTGVSAIIGVGPFEFAFLPRLLLLLRASLWIAVLLLALRPQKYRMGGKFAFLLSLTMPMYKSHRRSSASCVTTDLLHIAHFLIALPFTPFTQLSILSTNSTSTAPLNHIRLDIRSGTSTCTSSALLLYSAMGAGISVLGSSIETLSVDILDLSLESINLCCVFFQHVTWSST